MKNFFELVLRCYEKDEEIPLSSRLFLTLGVQASMEERLKIRKTLQEIPSILKVCTVVKPFIQAKT